MSNITAPLAHHARAAPERAALVQGERAILYRDFDVLVNRTAAHLLGFGLRSREVVAVALRDGIDHVVVLCALARAGIVILPLDWRWTVAEQTRVASHFGARLAVCEPDRPAPQGLPGVALDDRWRSAVERAPAAAETACDDPPLVISLSSGTTGRPKGPCLRHSHFLARFRVFWINLGFNCRDRFLSATPLYYGGGRTFALAMLHTGATTVMLPPPFAPEALCEAVAQHRITAVFLVPTLLRRLLALPRSHLEPLRRLRLLLSSGAALYPEERRELRARFPGFVEYYSSTEGGGVSHLTADDPDDKSGSVGRPVFCVEVQCVGEDHQPLPAGVVGQVRYRGPAVAGEFWNDPAASSEAFRDGWFYPGDLGMLDTDGYLYLKGRAKDMIIRGGINVYPAEIEAVLQSHPAVADCAVVGWPSREFNEEVAAFVVLRSPATPAELREHCERSLATYKIPREVFFVAELPRNALGKIIKTALIAGLPPL